MVQVEVLPVPDHSNLLLPGTTDDWLARDYDVDAPVYLFAYPSHASTNPHLGRWSIAWPVGGRTMGEMLAWRHIHPDMYDNEAGLETDPPRFVYGGAVTKTAGPGTMHARRFLLAVMGLAMRRKIEELAAGTPLAPAGDSLDADSVDERGWIKELLDRMVASAIIASTTRDWVVEQASNAFLTPHSPLVLGLCE